MCVCACVFACLSAPVLYAGGDVRMVLRHDEALSHRVYAGADFILIPSFFEPCGLTQLISLRYGTVPVVGLECVLAAHARGGGVMLVGELRVAEGVMLPCWPHVRSARVVLVQRVSGSAGREGLCWLRL